MKFGDRVRLKPSNDRGEFELDRAKSKTNIAENSFALGHETDNNYLILQLSHGRCPLLTSVYSITYFHLIYIFQVSIKIKCPHFNNNYYT